MGQSESQEGEEQIDAQQILDTFDVIRRNQDPKYGDSSLIQHKETKQQCVLREFNCTDENEHKRGIEKFRKRLELQHPNTVKLLKCFDKTDSQFCSTFYKTYLLLEYVDNTLGNDLEQRKEKGEYFAEGEIWNIMGGAIQGLAFLQKNGIAHGTIRTGTLYITEDQSVKVADPNVFQQLNNFATVCQDREAVPEQIYLAPLLLQALDEGNWQPNHNEFKSDVFSFGMTLLTIGLLDYCADCYSYVDQAAEFFNNQLETRLVQFSQRYSQDLTQFIMLMLKTEEEHRFDFIQLEEILIQQPNGQAQLDQYQPQQQPQQQEEQFIQQQEEQFIQQQKQQSPQQEVQEHKSHHAHSVNQQAQLSASPPQQQQQQQLQTSQQSNKPAIGMSRDDPDQGSKIIFAPKDEVAAINKPDENQGNEIGRGTYRDDIEGSPQQQQEEQQQQQPQQQQQQASYNQEYVTTSASEQQKQQQQNPNPAANTYQQQYIPTYTQPQSQQKSEEKKITSQYTPQYQVPYTGVSANTYQQPATNSYQPYQQSQVDKDTQELGKQLEQYGKISQQQQQPSAYKAQDNKQQQQSVSPAQAVAAGGVPVKINTNTYVPTYQAPKTDVQPQQQYSQPQTNYYQPQDQQQQNKTNVNSYQPAYTNSYTQPQQQQQDSNSNINNYAQQYQQSSGQQPQQQQQQQQVEYVIENYQNGSRYEGEKLNNMRHGKGKFFYQDNGGQYDGSWNMNKMHGKGTLYYASGKQAYEGDWVEDKFEGIGTLYNENPAQLQGNFDYKDFDLVEEFWTKYDGEFKDDNKDGYGTLYLSNGEKFSGNFSKDFVHGQGVMYTAQGSAVSGIWNNNKFTPSYN